MSQERALILLTRPRMQSERFAKMCRNELGAGPRIIISPLMEIEFLPLTLDVEKYQALIFTSENGVRAYVKSQIRTDLPAYCVGERTAKAALDAGFHAFSAKGSADELVALVQRSDLSGPLLHIRGEHTRGNIAKRIKVQVDEVVAYQQSEIDLSDDAQSALGGNEAVILPLFSPRTARLLIKHATKCFSPLQMVAISGAVKEAILGSNLPERAEIMVADAPNAMAMLSAIKQCIVTRGLLESDSNSE